MENNLIIRHMTKDDVDAVYKVEENCFTDPWSKDSIFNYFDLFPNMRIFSNIFL